MPRSGSWENETFGLGALYRYRNIEICIQILTNNDEMEVWIVRYKDERLTYTVKIHIFAALEFSVKIFPSMRARNVYVCKA